MSGEKTVSPLLVNVNGNKPSTEDHHEAEHAQACGQRVGSPEVKAKETVWGKTMRTQDSVW